MTKCWVVILAVVAGCGGDDKLKNNGSLATCVDAADAKKTAVQFDRRCSANNTIEECDGTYWRMTTDCAAQGMMCSQAPAAYGASCRSRKARGEECVGVEQGNCDATLVCLNNVCELACAPDAEPTGCVASEVCMPLQKGGYCKAMVKSGGFCDSKLECEGVNAACVPYGKLPDDQGGGLRGICGGACATPELYSQGSCSGGQVCGWNPGAYLDFQLNASGLAVACNLGASNPSQSCDTASGYYCVKWKDKTGYKDVCANANPICGKPLQCIGRWTDIPSPFPMSANCGLQGQDNVSFCTLGPGATASPRCLVVDQNQNIGFCVATCNDGTLAVDLDCGTGYSCYLPASDDEIVNATLQKKSDGSYVICDTAPCSPGYSCVSGFVSGAKVCALVHKMCRPNG